MISQEGQPGLGLVRSSAKPRLDHVLPDGVWAGWIETEEQQMSVDGFGAPQDIFATETSDQCSHFLADGWTASFASGFPVPPLEKGILILIHLSTVLGFIRPAADFHPLHTPDSNTRNTHKRRNAG